MTSMPRPKIGYVVKMFPRLSETFIRNEILELERQGLALRIFSLKLPTEAEACFADGIVRAPITYLPGRVWREPFRVLRAQFGAFRRYPRGYLSTVMHVLRGRELRSLGRGLRRFCQTCCLVHEMAGVRHLHAHFATDPTRLASWARMICGVSYSVTTHAKDLYQENRMASPGLRYKLSHARFVITNSDYSAARLRASFNGEAPPKIFTIYNGLDPCSFPPRRGEPAQPIILSVGRLVEKKGFQVLLEACRILRDRRVRFNSEIIGSGPLKDTLQHSIEGLGLEATVRLRGQMPQHELRAHYLKSMIFALPCIVAANGDRDMLPNVLKEAMALGVPVVTTRLAGIEELVGDEESGLLVPASDSHALAEALERLLDEPALRARLAARARAVVEERFDLQANFARLRELLLEVIGNQRAGTTRLEAGQGPDPFQPV